MKPLPNQPMIDWSLFKGIKISRRRVKVTLEESVINKKVENKFSSYSGNSYDEYQAWLLAWKYSYQELTQDIRYYKERRASSIYGTTVSDISTNRCRILRNFATNALEHRKEGKYLSQKQYAKGRLENV